MVFDLHIHAVARACAMHTHTQMKFLNITRMILQKSKRVEREAYISSLGEKKEDKWKESLQEPCCARNGLLSTDAKKSCF